jgi:hypothetical protein
MVCQTVKAGTECVFMRKNGCAYNGGTCYPVVEQCEGCDRALQYDSGVYCSTFPEPRLKWVNGNGCPMATHVKKGQNSANGKKVNPLKASKRKSSGR